MHFTACAFQIKNIHFSQRMGDFIIFLKIRLPQLYRINFLSIDTQLWKSAHSKLMNSLFSWRNFVIVRPGFALQLSQSFSYVFVFLTPAVPRYRLHGAPTIHTGHCTHYQSVFHVLYVTDFYQKFSKIVKNR